MPWTTNDVNRHNKNLTKTGKEKWVSIANSILSDCSKNNDLGNFDSCDQKAIIIANSKVGDKNKMQNELKELYVNSLIKNIVKENQDKLDLCKCFKSKAVKEQCLDHLMNKIVTELTTGADMGAMGTQVLGGAAAGALGGLGARFVAKRMASGEMKQLQNMLQMCGDDINCKNDVMERIQQLKNKINTRTAIGAGLGAAGGVALTGKPAWANAIGLNQNWWKSQRGGVPTTPTATQAAPVAPAVSNPTPVPVAVPHKKSIYGSREYENQKYIQQNPEAAFFQKPTPQPVVAKPIVQPQQQTTTTLSTPVKPVVNNRQYEIEANKIQSQNKPGTSEQSKAENRRQQFNNKNNKQSETKPGTARA